LVSEGFLVSGQELRGIGSGGGQVEIKSHPNGLVFNANGAVNAQ
jgi:hypothetical protein